MEITIRNERESDFEKVFHLVKASFKNVEFSDHQEHFLVNRLRKSEAFIPDLSLVAFIDDLLVGHILLTKLRINNDEKDFESLALAPVSVLPKFQNNGIGGKLILEAHKVAKSLGYTSIILLGHEKYYPKFGYERADKFGIELPFDAPKENCMAIELIEGALKEISEVVVYPKEFYE